jgi:hypothetical protein
MVTLKNLLDVVSSITSGNALESESKKVKKVYDLFKEIKKELESLANLNEQDFYLSQTCDFKDFSRTFLTGTFSKVLSTLSAAKAPPSSRRVVSQELQNIIKQYPVLFELQKQTLEIILPNETKQIKNLFKLTNETINSIITELGITPQDLLNTNFSEEYIHMLIEGKDIAISKSLITPSVELTNSFKKTRL